MIDDKEDLYRQQHFGGSIGFGTTPALLIIDFTVGFADPAVFGGGNISAAIARTVPLLAAARQARLCIAHTKIVYAEDGSDAGIHCLKSKRLRALTPSNPHSDFVAELRPIEGEIVISKRLPSAFMDTGLAGLLNARRVDTVVIAGCTTSGCVRASALDAMCHGFRPMVVTDCVGDRSLAPHEANLFDLGQKYADLMSLDDVLCRFQDNALTPPNA